MMKRHEYGTVDGKKRWWYPKELEECDVRR